MAASFLMKKVRDVFLLEYDEVISYIHSFAKFGSHPGLKRIDKLLALMDNPQDGLKFIHIAGTNGKGSTTALCASILKEAGYKTGMFISPYILEFRERFQINGKMISKEELCEIVSMIQPLIVYLNSIDVIITEFELVTAIAFQYFLNQRCDIVCLEVGLGGAIDSTNVIQTPEVAVITPISIDHVAYLGNTIEEIAKVKAGIIKCYGKTVCYPLQDINAMAVLMEKCALENNTFILPNKNAIQIINSNLYGTHFEYEGVKYKIHLAGEHQAYNAVTAITAVKNITSFPVTDEAVKKGIENTRFPARLEMMQQEPYVLLDGSHNIQGMQITAKALRAFQGSVTLLLGMLADKDVKHCVQIISQVADRMICTSVDNHRALPSAALQKIASKYCPNVLLEEDNEKALEKAFRITPKDGCLLICGSLYLASDMRKHFPT